MKTPMTHFSHFVRAAVLSAFALGAFVLTNGCDGGREGDRCNPNLSHNDCGSGLTCIQPSGCAENYCCPADPSKSSNPYCNGAGCFGDGGGGGTTEDAGTSAEAGGEEASTSGGDATSESSTSDASGD
jgi:hypothetical protein